MAAGMIGTYWVRGARRTAGLPRSRYRAQAAPALDRGRGALSPLTLLLAGAAIRRPAAAAWTSQAVTTEQPVNLAAAYARRFDDLESLSAQEVLADVVDENGTAPVRRLFLPEGGVGGPRHAAGDRACGARVHARHGVLFLEMYETRRWIEQRDEIEIDVYRGDWIDGAGLRPVFCPACARSAAQRR